MGIDTILHAIKGKKVDMPALREKGVDTENIPELPLEKLTYSALIKFIALKVIKEQGGQIARDLDPWLIRESPVLRLHKYLQRTKTPNQVVATAIAPGALSTEMEESLFNISWDEFTNLANANTERFKNLLKKSLPFIRNNIAKVTEKASRQFELTFITDRNKALKYARGEKDGVPEEDTILGEKGVYWQQVYWKNQENSPELRIQNIQLAMGSALIHTLRNQRNVAGHLDGKIHPLPIGYQEKVASYFTKIEGHPPKLKFTGWDEICGENEKLKELLKEKFSVIDEFSDSDCNDQFGYFPSGQIYPEINHPDFINQGFKAFKVRIFHQSGRLYTDSDIVALFQTNTNKLSENISSSFSENDSIFAWKYVSDLPYRPDQERWVPYSVSINLPPHHFTPISRATPRCTLIFSQHRRNQQY